MDRKRIVGLMHECTTEPYDFDDGWIARFMRRLHEEDPTLARAVMKAADDHEKQMKKNKPKRSKA